MPCHAALMDGDGVWLELDFPSFGGVDEERELKISADQEQRRYPFRVSPVLDSINVSWTGDTPRATLVDPENQRRPDPAPFNSKLVFLCPPCHGMCGRPA